MKLIKAHAMVAIWAIIADHVTNIGRAAESNPNSEDNLALIDQFAEPNGGQCGWSLDFPAILCHMTNWFFDKGYNPLAPKDGCTKEEYIQLENERRVIRLNELVNLAKAANDKDRPAAERQLRAYRELYCDETGKLHVLTMKNAYWVHSGHQRLSFVVLPAYIKWLAAKELVEASNADAEKVDPDFKPTAYCPFPTTIPAQIREFDSVLEILQDQTRGNLDTQRQNKPTELDHMVAARMLIGFKSVPRITENEYRAGGGETPRRGYQYALLDHQFGGGLGIYQGLLEPEYIQVAGSTERVKNPNHIPLANVSLGNKFDPMRNASVINRLCDQSLKGLTEYMRRNGPGRDIKNAKGEVTGQAPDLSSDVEKEVFKRGKAWTKEEFAAWVRTLKPSTPGYRETITKKPVDPDAKPKGLNQKAVEAILSSSATHDFVRDLVKDLNEGKIGDDAKALEALEGVKGKAMNAVFGKKTSDAFAKALVDVDVLADGKPELAAKLQADFVAAVDAAMVSLQAMPVEPVEGGATPANVTTGQAAG